MSKSGFVKDESKLPASEWLSDVIDAERRGEFLAAFDLAQRGLAAHPEDLRLKHRAVLALARSGATDQARNLFHALGLAGEPEEDVASLAARLAKDHALATDGAERESCANVAADLYQAIYQRFRRDPEVGKAPDGKWFLQEWPALDGQSEE